MTIGELSILLRRHPAQTPVEIRLVVNGDTYVSEPASVVPSRDHRGRTIVQITNES